MDFLKDIKEDLKKGENECPHMGVVCTCKGSFGGCQGQPSARP